MQRRRPNVVTRPENDIPFSLSEEIHFVNWESIARPILRYGSLYKATFSFVRTQGYLGTQFEVLISDPDHKRDLDRVGEAFGLTVGETDSELLNSLSMDGHQILVLLRQKIDQGVRVIGPELNELNMDQKKVILSSKLIANILFEFKLIEEGDIRRVSVLATKVEVLAVNDEHVRQGDLPNLEEFMGMSINEQLRYYRQHPDKISNRLGDYVLIYVREGNKYHVVERSQMGLLTDWVLVPTNEAFKLLKYELESTDIDGDRFHYRVVLSYSDVKYGDALNPDRQLFKDNLMESAKEYLARRHIDVRGIWYDEGREDRRSHVNLHVASELPKYYFSVLFDSWVRTHGLVYCDRVFEPLGWRVYAARNHHLLNVDYGTYKHKKETYRSFFGYLHRVLRGRVLFSRLPLEIITKIMDYIIVWDDVEEMTRMVNLMSF